MKLLKIASFLFVVYFIRRFIQAYKVMKEIQETNAKAREQQRPQAQQPAHNHAHAEIVDADFRVID